MNEIERYLFDTQGYLVVEDLLSPAEVQQALHGIPRLPDGTVAHRREPENQLLLGYDDPLFRDLICHPRILPYLEALLSQRGDPALATDPGFYLSHAYLMAMRRGESGPWFHNGGTPHEPWFSYRVAQGKLFCSLVAVAWVLTDAGSADGGFWCIPGSHKASFPLPRALQTYETTPACVVQPQVRAGSAIIFTEALTHGTRTWNAAHERIVLFYKYNAGWLADQVPDPSWRARVQALMAPGQARYLEVPRWTFRTG